ncbi:hypothetical protein QOT17_013556 [Balamuthia mandrillaris]
MELEERPVGLFRGVDVASLAKTKHPTLDASFFGEMVRRSFAQLYSNVERCGDITLLLLGPAQQQTVERLKAHKTVLCACSDRLRGMILSCAECPSELVIEDLSDAKERDCFKLMIKHMYTGATDFVDSFNVLPLLFLSDRYGVASLKDVCGRLLGEQVSTENMCFLLDVVQAVDCRPLCDACGTMLAERFGAMLRWDKGRLMSLPVDVWEAMLRSDLLWVHAEEEALDALLTYVGQLGDDTYRKHQVLKRLLAQIRFTFIDADALSRLLEAHKELEELPDLRAILYDAFKALLLPSYSPSFVNKKRRKALQCFDIKRGRNRANIILRKNNTIALLNAPNSTHTATLPCKAPLSPSYPYCEFHVLSGRDVALGLIFLPPSKKEKEEMDLVPDMYRDKNHSLAFHSHGKITLPGGALFHHSGGFMEGDYVGIGLDWHKRSFRLYVNGKEVRHLKARLPLLNNEDKRTMENAALGFLPYPTVSGSIGGAMVEINLAAACPKELEGGSDGEDTLSFSFIRYPRKKRERSKRFGCLSCSNDKGKKEIEVKNTLD